MKWLNRGLGYLLIDHRDSPGISPDEAAQMGVLAAPGGTVTERDIPMCSHCQRGVILNPGRVRARAVCPKCYHYICDGCEAIRVKTGACVPFEQVVDLAAEQTVKSPDTVVNVGALMQQERPLTLAVPRADDSAPTKTD